MDAFFFDPNVSSSFCYDAADVPKAIKYQSIHDNYLDSDKEQFMEARMELLSSNPTYDNFLIQVTGEAFEHVFFLTKL